MARVHGHCEDRFSNLRDLLQANFDSDEELGASLAVEIDGKVVIDLWGGYLDETKSKEWQENTIVNLWSVTKSISSLAMLVAVEKGWIDLDENVCSYWPEFAANGKEEVKVRHVMSHTSGLPAWEKPINLEEVYDVEKAAAKLAQQTPWWKPGTASGYHTITHGHLIGELIRRVTGKSLKTFVEEELAAPLGADFQLGARPHDHSRVATIIPEPPRPPPPSNYTPPQVSPDSIRAKAYDAPTMQPSVSNTKAWRDAELGAVNGHGNGRSIARILSPIALGGTVDGIKLLSPKTIDRIFEEQSNTKDLIELCVYRWGIGFALPTKGTQFDWAPTDGRVCGWAGWGGSAGIVDVDRRVTIGYAMNKMQDGVLGSACTKAYVAEIYKVLGVLI